MMHVKRTLSALVFTLFIAFVLLSPQLRASAQTPPQKLKQPVAATGEATARGIRLYEKGDMKGATKEFRAAVKRDKDDYAAGL